MIAVHFDRTGDPSVLRLAEHARPEPGAGSVLIHVRAAGISPVDLGLRAGTTPMASSLPLPHVPGVDAAGVVVALGDGVDDVRVGDEVFGSVDLATLGGATAEFAVLAAWAARPAEFPWSQAAGAGSSVETATRALDLLEVDTGTTVLVDGAAGGVGVVAAQLAVARGARVFGTARTESLDVVAALDGVTAIRAGMHLSHDLRDEGVDRVDRALDTSGAGVLPTLVALTGSPDRVVTIADFSAAEHGVRLTRGALAGEADGRHGLAEAARLAREGSFRVPLRGTFPFSQAAAAHRAAEKRPRWGKVILVNDVF
ncbi:NADPH:quinone reductase [Frondihabitans sucicola]|uniref:NADPH:quinone reductase n=1 Tax=Frondihabitans sucicola TaxID=1268041 RepID=A0ABM8GJD7_9MICO|nr:NADP-dependent oxidoreductase [Frondihabitans sucicola]BDZ48501.1 NADPH:quinone reductase [Frondihabitans sucicola]